MAISLHIPIELFLPKVHSRLRHSRLRAIAMAMPETSVNEDYSAIFRQDDVWSAGQILTMQPKADSKSVQ